MLTPQTLFTTIIVVLFLYGVWATNEKRGKIYCEYQGIDKTVEHKWIKVTDKKVKFAKRQFDVLPECISSYWDRKGIHALFPMKVNYLHFAFYSRYPLDPNDYQRTWYTPELSGMINLEDQLKSFFKNFTPSKTTGKLSPLMQYLPLITILLLIIVGFFLYSQQEGMKQVINMMQNQINSITPK